MNTLNGYSKSTLSDLYALTASGGHFPIHSGRNNEVNTLVRTDGNGYINAGWINTTSGNFTGTPDRIYASNDAYIRYMTPANFLTKVVGNNYWKVNDKTTKGGGDIYLEFWRDTNASWKILNTGGVLKFQSNYTSSVGDYFDAFTITYNSGNVWAKGNITAAGFIKSGSSDSYALLGGGGHKAIGNASGNIPLSNGTVCTNLNADLLDGTHKSGLFTALANVNNSSNPESIYATIGGTTKYLKVSYSLTSKRLENNSSKNVGGLTYHYAGGITSSTDATGAFAGPSTSTTYSSVLRLLSHTTSGGLYYRDLIFDVNSDSIWSRRVTNSGTPSLVSILHSGNSSVSGGGSSWGSSITVNIGGASKTLTIPANPNTWRAILVNGTLIAGTGTGTFALNFISGTGITVTGTAGSSSAANKVTITNAGVRSVTIGTGDNVNKLAVNTNGTTAYLTIPYATTAANTTVSLHTSKDTEYPLVWSNQNNTSTKTANQLYKSYSNLTYNPKHKRITASIFKGNLLGNINPFKSISYTAGTSTVKNIKDELVTAFTDISTGIGANIIVPAYAVNYWGTESTVIQSSSVYSMIKIGGGYGGTTYGLWLLSTYSSNRIGYVGRSDNAWTSIYWLANTNDIDSLKNYYWANIKISATSNAATTPTFAQVHITKNDYGTLSIGSQNASYTHYSTTGGTHWFNKAVEVNGNHSPHANNSFSIGTSSKRWSNVYSVLGNFSSTITGAGTIQANRFYLRHGGSTGVYADLQLNTRGTTSATGVTYLLLGNSTASGTAENALGRLRLYGTSSGYTDIICGTNNTSGYTLYLPGATGLLVYHTNDEAIGSTTTPVYITSGGAATAGTSYAKAIKAITRSGTTFTYTCIDGTTGTFTLQDNNSTYAVYGKTIDASYKTAYRTQTGRASGYYLSAIRCDTASVDRAPLYGSGMAFGMADTHGYLYMNYSSANAYIGAGNADKLNWTATLLHSENSSVSGGGSSWGSSITVKINGTTATLTIPSNPNTDTKVTNTLATTTKFYLTGTSSASTNTGTLYFDTGIYSTKTAGLLFVTSLNVNSKLNIDSTGRVVPASTSVRNAGVYGVYDSNKVGHVWSMGTGYAISADGSSTNNMYGLVYFHTNWSNDSTKNATKRDNVLITEVSTYASGHQIALAANGVILSSLGSYVWSRSGFKKNGSSDSYVLLGGGGHKTISSLSVSNADTVDNYHISVGTSAGTNASTIYFVI